MQQEIKNNKLIIFDTTLRDGEQSPGASMTQEEKLRIARQLEKLGVDVIEAGFAAASPGDFESISAVAKNIKESTILIHFKEHLSTRHSHEIASKQGSLDIQLLHCVMLVVHRYDFKLRTTLTWKVADTS